MQKEYLSIHVQYFSELSVKTTLAEAQPDIGKTSEDKEVAEFSKEAMTWTSMVKMKNVKR